MDKTPCDGNGGHHAQLDRSFVDDCSRLHDELVRCEGCADLWRRPGDDDPHPDRALYCRRGFLAAALDGSAEPRLQAPVKEPAQPQSLVLNPEWPGSEQVGAPPQHEAILQGELQVGVFLQKGDLRLDDLELPLKLCRAT